MEQLPLQPTHTCHSIPLVLLSAALHQTEVLQHNMEEQGVAVRDGQLGLCVPDAHHAGKVAELGEGVQSVDDLAHRLPVPSLQMLRCCRERCQSQSVQTISWGSDQFHVPS